MVALPIFHLKLRLLLGVDLFSKVEFRGQGCSIIFIETIPVILIKRDHSHDIFSCLEDVPSLRR